jgi:hypothetical protein
MKMKKMILPIVEASPVAKIENPNIAATSAISRNVIVQRNISLCFMM